MRIIFNKVSYLRAFALILLTLAAVVGLTACSSQQKTKDIVVTTNILGDVVAHLVGDSAAVHVLMKPNSDPHSFGISAKDAALMENADLIVANGLGLEEGLQSNVDNARSQGVPILEVGEQIDTIEYSPGLTDPHFWTDPRRMLSATEVIEEKLSEVTGNPDALTAAATSYRQELSDMDSKVTALLEEVPEERRRIITNHNAFGYMANRFNYDVIGTIIPGGTTLASPSAADLQELTNAIRDNSVPAIFADSSHPQKLAEVLASESGLDVHIVSLFTESLSEPDGDAGTYIDMQLTNASRINAALVP